MTNQERIQSHNEQLAEIKEIAAGLPDAGAGGGAAVEYEIVTIPAGATSATYTLPRITKAIGSIDKSYDEIDGRAEGITGIVDNLSQFIGAYPISSDSLVFVKDRYYVTYENGVITLTDFPPMFDLTLLLINDPNADAISS